MAEARTKAVGPTATECHAANGRGLRVVVRRWGVSHHAAHDGRAWNFKIRPLAGGSGNSARMDCDDSEVPRYFAIPRPHLSNPYSRVSLVLARARRLRLSCWYVLDLAGSYTMYHASSSHTGHRMELVTIRSECQVLDKVLETYLVKETPGMALT